MTYDLVSLMQINRSRIWVDVAVTLHGGDLGSSAVFYSRS